MGAIVNSGANTQGPRQKRPAVEPIVAEIIEALLRRGGSAHRQVVADHIASVRAGVPVTATREIQQEVYAGFERYFEVSRTRRPAPLLHRPLGLDSYRWALTPSGERLFTRVTARSRRQVH